MGIYKKLRKDGTNAWFYDFSHNKVRYRGVGGETKTQALRTLNKVREKILNEEFEIVQKFDSPRIEKFAELFLARRNDIKSIRREKQLVANLLVFLKGKTLSKINPADIEDYKLKRLNDGVANATINREISCLNRIYTNAIKWGDAKKNPVTSVNFLKEPPGRTRYLSNEEAINLIKASSDYLRPVIITALNTGMRLKKILNLKWENVYLDNVIDPYIETESKNNKKRYIPLNDVMIELVTRLKKINYHSPSVILNSYGKPYKHITYVFYTALTKAGISNFRFHDLRHTFASHFIMSGGDILTLKEILGHSSMKMVERYTHLATSHKRKQVNNLNTLFSECHPNDTQELLVNQN